MKQPQVWTALRLHTPPGASVRGEQVEKLLAVLWGKLVRSWWSAWRYGETALVYEVRADQHGVTNNWVVPAHEAKHLAAMLAAALPDVTSEVVPDYLKEQPPGTYLALQHIKPSRPAAFAIADYTPAFGQSLHTLMERCRNQGDLLLQVRLRPLQDAAWKRQAWNELARAEGKATAGGGSVLAEGLKMFLPGADGPARPPVTRLERLATRETPKKLLGHAWGVTVRLMATAETADEALSNLHRMTSLFSLLDGANHLQPTHQYKGLHAARLWPAIARRERGREWLTLSPAELASLLAPVPTASTNKEGVRVIELKQPPLTEGLYLCDAQYRGKRVQVRVTPQDLDQHTGIFGETGTGKGVLLENVVREIAELDLGGAFFDPMGNSVKKVLASLPERHLERVVWVEAGHPKWAVPLNILNTEPFGGDPESATSEAVNLFYKLWESAWGQSTQEYLTAAARAAVDMGGTLVEAERLLADPAYRQRNLGRVANESIRKHLENLPDKISENMRAPLNKLHDILWKDALYVMVGQESTLDWRRLISERHIILVNGGKGNPKVGKLGCMLVTSVIWSQLLAAAMSFAPRDRKRFVLIADELADVVQRSAGDFKDGLIQLRQFQKPIFGAGQYAAQLPADVLNAMEGTGGKIILRQDGSHARSGLAYLDAERTLTTENLSSLPNLVGYANLLTGGRKTGLFTCWAPPFSQALRDPDEAAEKLLARWAQPREHALDAINKRLGGGAPRPLK